MHDDTTLCLRAMRHDDLPAVLAVQAACYPPSMQEPAATVLARCKAAPGSCLVALDREGVCAYLFGYRSRLGVVTPLGAGFEPAPDADTFYLHDLAVAPRGKGRGLGRALVARAWAWAGGQGLRASALVSVQDTRAFWTGLGYRAAALDCGAARAALASYPGAAHYMTRPLTGPDAPSPNC